MNSIGQIIVKYRKKAGLSQVELAEKLAEEGIDVTNRAVSAWEKDKFDPGSRAFLTICRILSVPDVMEELFGSNPADPLSALNDEGKKKALDYIDMLMHPVSYMKEDNIIPFPAPVRKEEKHLRALRLYDIRVSAGTGNMLDSDYYTMIDVEEDRAAGADFAVTISGDSMEPAFHDHQMVFVHQQDTLDDGETGIFALNGNAYIKKLKNDKKGIFLISLNKKYDPIPVHPETDSFRIFGRVCGR